MNTSSAASASQVVTWVTPTVTSAGGSFASILNQSAAISAPWNFASSGTAPFWEVGGFTFDIVSSKVTDRGGTSRTGYVNVTGTGTIAATGFQTTSFTFTFSAKNGTVIGQPERFTLAITPTLVAQAITPTPSASVPDGGVTLLLLGLTLSGAALARKKMTA